MIGIGTSHDSVRASANKAVSLATSSSNMLSLLVDLKVLIYITINKVII